MEKWAKKYSALLIFVRLIQTLSWVQGLLKDDDVGLCYHLIRPLGYPCIEHTVVTKDGFMLGIQNIPYGIHDEGILTIDSRPPVFLQHGLFQGGDTWFQNSKEQSLGFILADSGFDVWIGNVRGTRWSYGHVSFSEGSKAFWDWSWDELAAYDLPAMIEFVYSVRGSKVYYVGHSQGTIMGLAAFTQSEVLNMIAAAALLSPISYLDHITSSFARTAVNIHLDQMMISMGLHQINFRTKIGLQLMDYVCALEDTKCGNLLTSITVIRKGTFEKYDYGLSGNIKHYGSFTPIPYDLSRIPISFPLWMAYGGNDALADAVDCNHTLSELKSNPELVYLESYGHLDFILSVNAKEDLYDSMVKFFRSQSRTSYTV